MPDFSISVDGIKALEQKLARAGGIAVDVANRGLARCGLIAKREAKKNAPRSPTKKQHSATLKRKKRTKIKMFTPGGLEKSIDATVSNGACIVFVASNSYAGKYAKRIHDEKGKTWRKRGPGTIAKGVRADEKFISRAINANADNFKKILDNEIEKAMGRLK